MIVGKQQDHRDHDLALTTLLDIARKCNVQLNFDRLQYRKTEVDFFGETYTTSGHKPAQSKVSAITEMPAPTCKMQVQLFIGMINYLSKFSATLSEFAEPIRELSKEKVPFNWGLEHQEAFKLMKKSLAVAWTMEKFHHFLYASHFILETDQKPLEAILSKSLNQATQRLQRILIRTFQNHFTVHYFQGVTNQLANCLSRLGGQKDTIKLPKVHLYQIINQLCARSDSLNQLRVSIQADDGVSLVKHTIMQGWPSSIKQVPQIFTTILDL